MSIKWVEKALLLMKEKEDNITAKKKLKQGEKLELDRILNLSAETNIPAETSNNISSNPFDDSIIRNSGKRSEKGPTLRASYESATQAKLSHVEHSLGDEPDVDITSSANDYNIFKSDVPPFTGGFEDDKCLDVTECSLTDDPQLNRQLFNDLQTKLKSPKYRAMISKREQLPAYKLRRKVIDGISRNRVVVISGDTGCG